MSSNDDGATKSDKIGDALVTALGFEPTDSESQRQAEISEQMSDTGFTVTDVLDRDDDDLDDEEVEDELVDEFDESDDADSEVEELDDEDFDDDDDLDDLDDLDDFDDAPVDEAGPDDEDVDEEAIDELDDDDDESDDSVEAFVDSEDADASIGDVEDEDDSDSDDVDSSSSAAESEDPETVIDSVVDATEDSASSNGATVAPASTGFFGSRRSGFGRSGSKDKASKDKASNDKVYADTAFPGVESDPDITLIPDSPAITGEHEVVRVEADEPTVVQTREAVESRGVLDTVPSWGGITGWRPGGRRLQARKVRRVVRHIDPWSVLTFSVLFFLCLFAALLLASVLVWNVAEEAGTIENVENFILELGDYESFEIDGESIFRAAVAIMGVFTLAASVMVVLLTVMFNLLSDLLGGIRITVIEEETIRVRPRMQLEPASDTELLE